MKRTLMLPLVVLTCLAQFGCPPSPGSKQLTFTYDWQTFQSGAAPGIVRALQSGARTFSDPALNHVNCDFVADYSAPLNAQPVFHAFGTLGQPGFNVDFDGGTLVRVASEQPCPGNAGPLLTGVHVSSDQNIAVGTLSHGGRIVISVGNDTFTSDHGYIEFTLTSFDTTARRASGTFQVLTTSQNPQDTRVLIVRNGSFSMPF